MCLENTCLKNTLRWTASKISKTKKKINCNWLLRSWCYTHYIKCLYLFASMQCFVSMTYSEQPKKLFFTWGLNCWKKYKLQFNILTFLTAPVLHIRSCQFCSGSDQRVRKLMGIVKWTVGLLLKIPATFTIYNGFVRTCKKPEIIIKICSTVHLFACVSGQSLLCKIFTSSCYRYRKNSGYP